MTEMTMLLSFLLN